MPAEQPSINIRHVREDDLNEWLRLRKILWDETEVSDHRHEMTGILEHPDSQLVLVADAGNGHLGGFLEASIRPFVEDCDTDHVGYLEGWFVESEYRRHGVGRLLVETAENWARSQGCTEMASDTEVGNKLSLDVHQSLGYEISSKLIHLRKDLE
jgi:aminoglycoside 6'-N-acetyltransferase I